MKITSASERMYSLLIKFYPKSYTQKFGEEMKFVFSESLKDAIKENGSKGVYALWTATFLDASKSIFIEYLDELKGGGKMKTKNKDIIMQNKVFAYLALITGGLLAIPYLAMTFQWIKPDPSNPMDQGVNWTFGDFLIMGILIFGAGSLFIAIARRTPKKNRIVIGLAIMAAFLLLWAHLAVGIVDTWPLAGS